MKPLAAGSLMGFATAMSLVAACNAIWGVGDLEYLGVGGTVVDGGPDAAGGALPDGSTGGGGAGGGAGGGGGPTCDTTTCQSCLATGCGTGCKLVGDLCMDTMACATFGACVQECSPADAQCQAACALAMPQGVHQYYGWLDCAACETETPCSEPCSAICTGGCSVGGGCLDCANDSCAQDACLEEISACAASSQCQSFNTCVTNCATSTCTDQCISDHQPSAITLYNQWARCALCTKAACWDDCSTTPFDCAGY